MIVTIELPPEMEARVRAAADSYGEDLNTFTVTALEGAVAEYESDPTAIREIGEALAEAEAAEARGDYGVLAEDAFAELARRAEERSARRRAEGADQRLAA